METDADGNNILLDEDSDGFDAIKDIIDYLVRCANISFKNPLVNESSIKTSDKVEIAQKLFTKSPTQFLIQFGKYLSPNHLSYFENLQNDEKFKNSAFEKCVNHLKMYHSERSKHKRIRNRRYRALQKMQEETDYFSEKQMMLRNPLLYEQLIGQYLNEEEILKRDTGDIRDLTFLNIILSTVDMNDMNERKHRQMIAEDLEAKEEVHVKNENNVSKMKKKMWGDFDEPDNMPSPKLKVERLDAPINSQERALLKEEFFQEMYSSFLQGRDEDIDYDSIDNNDQYDDLHQISQDAEDKYFDSENNDVNNLEEHMELVREYGNKITNENKCDPLDVFMKHIEDKVKCTN